MTINLSSYPRGTCDRYHLIAMILSIDNRPGVWRMQRDTSVSRRLLESPERRVLWLATAMVDHANNVRVNDTGLKVGGHQASSASMVSIMTALWFEHLGPLDRVSVKPHASPR